MIISVSWKNVWRNKSRSMIVIIAVVVGSLAGMFFSAWMKGLFDQKVHDAIYTEVGHLKIMNPLYLIDEDISYTISDFQKVSDLLGSENDIKAWTPRSKVVGMAATSRETAGVTLVGIDPEREKQVSDLYTRIIEGTGDYFEAESRYPTAVIGEKLAEELRIKNYRISMENRSLMLENGLPEKIAGKLDSLTDVRFVTKRKFDKALADVLSKAEVNSYGFLIKHYAGYFSRARITFTFTSMEGKLAYLTCRVSGIYKTSNAIFDVANVFVRNDILAQAAGLEPDQFHEISIIAADDLDADNIENVRPLKDKLAKLFMELQVMDIEQVAPEAYAYQIMSKPMMYIIMILIYFALAFGIINTMLMAIMERIKEIGMLRAIGMKRKKVARMIIYETIFLTFVGTVAGMLLSLILIGIIGRTGINLFGHSFEDFGFSAVIYPKLTTDFFFLTILIVLLISILAAIIPARKALKMKPIKALRKE